MTNKVRQNSAELKQVNRNNQPREQGISIKQRQQRQFGLFLLRESQIKSTRDNQSQVKSTSDKRSQVEFPKISIELKNSSRVNWNKQSKKELQRVNEYQEN